MKKRRILAAVSTLAACAVIVAGGFAYYNNPINFVSFDVNPSVELGINAFDRVVSTEAYNDDGSLILAGQNLRNLKLEDALDALLLAADEQGYIAEDGSSVVAVTAESTDDETATELQTRCEERLMLTIRTREISAGVYSDCTNLQLRTQARELGISPGKYKLIEVLQSVDRNATMEQFRNAKVSEIMARINNQLMLSGNNSASGEYAGQLERIRTMTRQMLGDCDNQQQNMNPDTGVEEQNQLNNQGTETQIQEQIRNGTQSDNVQQQTSDQYPEQTSDNQSGYGQTNEAGDNTPAESNGNQGNGKN